MIEKKQDFGFFPKDPPNGYIVRVYSVAWTLDASKEAFTYKGALKIKKYYTADGLYPPKRVLISIRPDKDISLGQ